MVQNYDTVLLSLFLCEAQVSGCAPVYPEDPNANHTHSSVWSTVFVTLVGILLLIVFQFSFCWVLHRRRAQQFRSEMLIMRRLLELMDEGEQLGSEMYYAVYQPDGDVAAAKRCANEEQTPGSDGKLPTCVPGLVSLSVSSSSLRNTREDDDENRRRGNSGVFISAGTSVAGTPEGGSLEGGDNIDDAVPSVAVAMGLDDAEEAVEARRRRRRGLTWLLPPPSPMMTLFGLMPHGNNNNEPVAFDTEPNDEARNMRRELLARLRERGENMPRGIVARLQDRLRHEQEIIWNQIQRERGVQQQQQQNSSESSGSGRGSMDGETSSGGHPREGRNEHHQEGQMQEVVVGGFDESLGDLGTGSVTQSSRHSLDNFLEAERREVEREAGGGRLSSS